MKIFFNHHLSSIADIVSSIRKAHPDVGIAASHARRDGPLQGLLDEVVREPDMPESGDMPGWYPAWLRDTAKAAGADVVIPGRHAASLASGCDAWSENGIRLLTVGSVGVPALIEAKSALLSRAARLGILITPFTCWSEAAGFRQSIREMSGLGEDGLCIKPVSGIYAEGFRRLVDETEPDACDILLAGHGDAIGSAFLEDLLETRGPGPIMMTMPFLRGRERSVDIASLDGRVLGAVTRTKYNHHQVVGHDETAFEMARLLVEDLNLSGLVNIQTIEDRSGRQHLLEMNGRASGGIGMSAFSGVDLPALLVSGLKGDVVSGPQLPKRPVRVATRVTFANLGPVTDRA